MRTDFLSPLFLSKNLGNFPASYDARLFGNSYDFLNPNKTPMLVDQFRFTIGQQVENLRFQVSPLRYGEIDVEIRVGATPITNGFVPITSFCPVYRVQNENMFVWHLPKPMYVPRDVGISASFSRRQAQPGIEPSEIGPLTFSIAGRSVPMGWPVPKEIFAPWAAATYVNTELDEWVSQDNELVNVHEEPLVLQQLIGFSYAGNQPALNTAGARLAPVTVQATQSQNKMLVRDPTPFNLLFPPDRRFLAMSGVLAPKEFVRVALKVNPPPNASAPNTYLAFTTVGMVGYRKMQTPWGAPAK